LKENHKRFPNKKRKKKLKLQQ